MRSEGSDAVVDCEDPMTVIACTTDAASCPAACRENGGNNGDNTVVKAGDLEVTASANSSRKVIKGGVSDLDTLKFRTSEEVTLTKITLERYGYSSYESVESVWLEDEDGNIIAEERELNSKDVVTLSLKKDYRTVDGTFNAVVVVRMAEDVAAVVCGAEDNDCDPVEAFSVGSTIGFKVTDVSSTAKNVDLGDYSPFTYEIVDYTAGGLAISANATLKKYNYEAKESYEIARFKLRAGDAAVSLYGFTLENRGNLSTDEFVDSLTVTVDGKKVSGLKYSFNKDDELVVSFNEENIGIRKTATVIVSASFNEEFDEYGHIVAFVINNSDDVNAVETKTAARVDVTGYADLRNENYGDVEWSFPAYQFNGSKVKLSGTKLGTVDAAQGSEGMVIASGEISLSEPIYKGEVQVAVTSWGDALPAYVDKLTLVIGGDEYDSKYNTNGGYYYFSNVEVEKSGKVQLKIDIANEEFVEGTIKFGGLRFVGFVYETNKNVPVDPTGSITVSTVNIQAPSASLKNEMTTTKSVQYIAQESSRKTVFEGTYTAKKGDVYLNKLAIATYRAAADSLNADNVNANYNYDRTFYVTIDGEEVSTDEVLTTISSKSDINGNTDAKDFSNILVKDGKSVSVKVEAEIDAVASNNTYAYTLYLRGEDENGNQPSGVGEEDLVSIKVVSKGAVTIPTASSSKNTVILKAKNETIAQFVVKPSNNNEGLDLENLLLSVVADEALAADDDYKVVIVGDNNTEEDYSEHCVAFEGTNIYECTINKELPKEGLTVKVILRDETVGTVTLEVMGANVDTEAANFNPETLEVVKTFDAKYASALVDFTTQDSEDTYTTYTLRVRKFDDNYIVDDVHLFTVTDCANAVLSANDSEETPTNEIVGIISGLEGEVEDGETVEIENLSTTQIIGCITYRVSGGDDLETPETVQISKKTYPEYFKIKGSAWRVFAKTSSSN